MPYFDAQAASASLVTLEEVEPMPYSPTMIANNILQRSFAEKRLMTPMKLQKILYFAASYYQRKTGERLLADPFQCWSYGPVVYSVYDEFRPFSKRDITKYAQDATGRALVIDESEDRHLRDALDLIWAATKNRSAVNLSAITHEKDSAWDFAFQAGREYLDDGEVGSDTSYDEPLGLRIS